MTHWYEQQPELLEVEKKAMSKVYPHFKLEKLDDGHLYWIGELQSIINREQYTFIAVYNNKFPLRTHDNCIRLYPICPDYNELWHKWENVISFNHNYIEFQPVQDEHREFYFGFSTDLTGLTMPQSAINYIKYYECLIVINEILSNIGNSIITQEYILKNYPHAKEYIKQILHGTTI